MSALPDDDPSGLDELDEPFTKDDLGLLLTLAAEPFFEDLYNRILLKSGVELASRITFVARCLSEGWSQADAAERVGVSVTTVGRYVKRLKRMYGGSAYVQKA